jgi:hypothetical protein
MPSKMSMATTYLIVTRTQIEQFEEFNVKIDLLTPKIPCGFLTKLCSS